MFPPPCSSLLCLVNARNCMFDGGRRREGYCIEDRDGCDKAELSRRSQRRKLRSKPFSTTFETAAVEFRPKFPPPPPPPLCVYVYTRICIRVCVRIFFIFFFYPGDADENRNSMVSKICLSHLASSSFNPQFVRAASTTSDRFRFHPPSRRTL